MQTSNKTVKNTSRKFNNVETLKSGYKKSKKALKLQRKQARQEKNFNFEIVLS